MSLAERHSSFPPHADRKFVMIRPWQTDFRKALGKCWFLPLKVLMSEVSLEILTQSCSHDGISWEHITPSSAATLTSTLPEESPGSTESLPPPALREALSSMAAFSKKIYEAISKYTFKTRTSRMAITEEVSPFGVLAIDTHILLPAIPQLTAQRRFVCREAIKTRYALLPYIYTIFRQSHESGAPVLRPLW